MDYEAVAAAGRAARLGLGDRHRRHGQTWPGWSTRRSTSSRHESCGKCTPCREGTYWMAHLTDRIADGQGRRGGRRPAERRRQPDPGQVPVRAGRVLDRWPCCSGIERFRGRFRSAPVTERRLRQSASAQTDGATRWSNEWRKWYTDHRWQPVDVPEGTLIVDAAKTDRHRYPGVLLPSQDGAGGHVPHVPGRDRPPGRSTAPPASRCWNEDGSPKIQFGPKLETACTTPVSEGMVVRGTTEKVTGGPQGYARVPADLAPARLPDLRQGRRMPAAEPDHGATARARAASCYDEKMHLAKHVPAGRPDLPGPRALHPVRALHPLPGRDRRRPGDRLLRARPRAGDRHLSPSRASTPTSRATPPISARSAR